MKKRVLWFGTTLGYWAAAYFGINGHPFAWNAFVFLCWFLLFGTICAAVNVAKDERARVDRSVPAWIDIGSDLAGAIMLAGFGHFVYATITLVQMSFLQGCYKKDDNANQNL